METIQPVERKCQFCTQDEHDDTECYFHIANEYSA